MQHEIGERWFTLVGYSNHARNSVPCHKKHRIKISIGIARRRAVKSIEYRDLVYDTTPISNDAALWSLLYHH